MSITDDIFKEKIKTYNTLIIEDDTASCVNQNNLMNREGELLWYQDRENYKIIAIGSIIAGLIIIIVIVIIALIWKKE